MKRNKLSKSLRKRKGRQNSKKHNKRSNHRRERLLGFKRRREGLIYSIKKKQLEEINKIIKEQAKEKEEKIVNT